MLPGWYYKWMVAGHIIEYYISFLVCNACFMYTGMEDTQQKRERIFFITHILYIYFVYYNMMRCVVPLEIIKYLIAWLLIIFYVYHSCGREGLGHGTWLERLGDRLVSTAIGRSLLS